MPNGCSVDPEKMAPRFPIPRTSVVRRVPQLLRLSRGRKVLHLGCTNAPHTLLRGDDLLHKQLAAVTPNLWGLDRSQDGVRLLRQMGFEKIILGDAEELGEQLYDEHFEVIIAGEIIEHLANPGKFIESVKAIMHTDTDLILTTVNATAIKACIHALLRREKVKPDHNCYFSYRTLKQLTETFGLRCKGFYYYQEIQGQGRAKAVDHAFALLTRITPAWADGVISIAALENSGAKIEERQRDGIFGAVT